MNVLVGVDGSERAFAAFERLLARVRETGDELTVAVIAGETERPGEIERRVREVLDDAEVVADVRRIEGHAGGGLVDLADEEGFDRVVVGGGERTPMGKIRLGPTAEFVVLNAETTVTLAR